MEKETVAPTAEVSVVKVVEDSETNGDLLKVAKGGNKEEEEESALDGEFIKVEKEPLDVKDCSEKPLVIERSSSTSSRELLEAHEKTREVKIELESVAEALKRSESENTQLKEEVSLTKHKLDESTKKSEDLEMSHKKLQEKIIEVEEKCSVQLNTLQEALQAQEAKHKELIEVKEAFDSLSLELENSKKKMQDVENELQISSGETKRYEELHKQISSRAESETQRALEFERLHEVTKQSAKEMEDRMGAIQEELNSLYKKLAEKEKVEDDLKSTSGQLSAAHEELALSVSQVRGLEERLCSKEAVINELTQELDLKKASESQVKEDILALENLFVSTKEDLQAKALELEEIKLKFQEEVNTRELAEEGLKGREAQISTVQDELAKLINEKEALEAALADLTSNAAQMKELCGDLEEKLKVSDENFCKTDSLLSQALSSNAELEQKLKSLEVLHNETGIAAAIASQKNIELEDKNQASNAAAEEAKSQLRELETLLAAAEQKNVELEQQLNLAELKGSDAERELKEYFEKVSDLNTTLKGVEEEKERLNVKIQEYQDKMTQLESSLDQSSLKNSELEQSLKTALEKCAEHEERVNVTHQRGLELEDMIQMSHSKAEDSGRRVNELELLLETEKYRIQELEEQIRVYEKKCEDAEADSKRSSGKIAELVSELEAFQARSSTLEIALQVANEKEMELTESLNAATDGKRRVEEALNISNEKCAEAENLSDALRNELNLTQGKLESVENELKAVGMQGSKAMEKLKSAEEKLETQERIIEQATATNTELESLHESLTRDSELKLQEAFANFTNKDSEAKSLSEKLKVLEDQVTIYEKQVAEAAERSASLREELDQTSTKLATSESLNEKLSKEVTEVENKVAQSVSENEQLVQTNIQLKSKVDELQELLDSAISEKEVTGQQLASHLNSIMELTEQQSRASELQSASEVKISEAEVRLQEAIQRFSQRDSEAKDLIEKLCLLEGQVKIYEEQAREASAISESRQFELEQTLLKLRQVESIVEELQTKCGHFEKESEQLVQTNIQLKSKVDELQELLASAISEKEVTGQQLASHLNSIMELREQQSRASELQFASEARISEAEVQLQEAVQRFNRRDSEAKDLVEKLGLLEGQVKIYEEQAREASAISESRQIELEQTLLKLRQVESIVEELQTKCGHFEKESEQLVQTNIQLKSKVDELQELLASAISEKEVTGQQLASHLNSIMELREQQSRASELQSASEARISEAEVQLQEAVQRFSRRDSEAKDLIEKLGPLEGQVKIYEEQAREASAISESRQIELEQTLLKLTQVESIVEELQTKCGHFEKESEQLVQTNIQLKSKVDELQESLASAISEKEVTCQQLASHLNSIMELTEQQSRVSELQSASEARISEAEAQLQKAVQRFSQRDSEAKDLVEKLDLLEEQVKIHEEQAREASAISESRQFELEQTLLKLRQVEIVVEELQTKCGHFEKESVLLVQANIQLKSKVDELQELLASSISEKEVTGQQLASHLNNIRELTEQQSRASELQSVSEARISEAEAQLQEAVQRFSQRDSEAKDLIEKLGLLEGQVKIYEQQAGEASAISESRQIELEQALLKLRQVEVIVEELQTKCGHFEKESGGLSEANVKLTEELAAQESKLSELQPKLSSVLIEKHEIAEQLQVAKNAIEDLTQQYTSEGEKLKSQISSLFEENSTLNESHQSTKTDLESIIDQLKEAKANEVVLKSEIDNLMAEIAEKSVLQTRLKEVEEQLVIAENRQKEEVESFKASAAGKEAELNLKMEDLTLKACDRDALTEQVVELQLAQASIAEKKEAESQKVLELEAASKKYLEELEAKKKEVTLVKKQVEELEHKLQLTDANMVEKVDKATPTDGKDGVEIKSRDFELPTSAPTKRKSKKKLEATSAQTTTSASASASGTNIEVSSGMSFKFILGIALVSVIVGVILGKQY